MLLATSLALGGCSAAASSSSTSSTTTTPLPTKTTNLTVDDGLRAELLVAGAEAHGLPATDFTGLVRGLTYYAFDAVTKTFWAAAQLVPSPNSNQAQVSVQDDGSYDLFMRTPTGSWQAFNDGLAGVGGASCPVDVPPSVAQVWQWPPGSCRPPGT